MKKVAVFAHKITIEYALNAVQGVQSFFADKEDVQLFIAQTIEPHYIHGVYEYQYWAGAELLKNKEIDLYIIVTSSYCTYRDSQGIAELFSSFSDRPIISISAEIPLNNVKQTAIDVDSAYYKIIRHLKTQHFCHKIGFMSANLTGSKEAEERLQAFRNAMAKNKLPINENWILNGTFTQFYAETLIQKLYKSKKDIPYDALICANDFMAVGALRAFKKLGVKIPKELKIFGFDDISYATSTSPSLSTINQDILNNGRMAGEIAFKTLNGQTVSDITKVPVQVRYRQSCGCIKISDSIEVHRLKALGRKHERHTNEMIEEKIGIDDINNIYMFFDPAKSNANLLDIYQSIQNNMSRLSLETITLCLYEMPVYCNREDDFTVPKKACLKMHVNENQELSFFETENEVYNPRENLLPQKVCSLIGRNILFQPLFAGEIQYGYILCNPKNNKYAVNTVYLKIINTMITTALERSNTMSKIQRLDSENEELMMRNTDLKKQSMTDELTQVLNRRGFLEMGQKLLNLSKEMNNNGLVFFGDIDGLKKINDNYGHAMGDKAIMLQAQALNFVFRKTDIIGRLSGDEFAIVAPGTDSSFIDVIRKKLLAVHENLVMENNLPFELSMSLSAVEFSSENNDIESLLHKADEKMYSIKKARKIER